MAEQPSLPNANGDAHAATQAGVAVPSHPEPTALSLDSAMWVALAMVVVIAIALWKKVPGAIAKSLDAKIDIIRRQLAEAETLRKEAEALKAEYEAKAKAADGEAAAMVERAEHEAEAIIAKAKSDAEALVARRQAMAEAKIAAEERAAVEALRARVATVAGKAAEQMLAERGADAALVDQAIARI